MKQFNLKEQKGIGAIILLLAVVIIVVAFVAMIYFLLHGSNQNKSAKQNANQNSANQTVSSDQVPYKICATGDPDQCDDPVPNSAVDKVKVDDLP